MNIMSRNKVSPSKTVLDVMENSCQAESSVTIAAAARQSYNTDYVHSRNVRMFETLLAGVGEFGRYQMFLTLVILYSTVMWAGNMAFNVFGFLDPTWGCDNNDTESLSFNESTGGNENELSIPDIKSNVGFLTTEGNATVCTVLQNCSKVIVVESVFDSLIQQWMLYCNRDYTVHLIAFVETLCRAMGNLVGGLLGDLKGRKSMLLACQFAICITSVLTTATIAWLPFLIMQVVNETLYGIVEVCAYVLAMEYTDGRHRYIFNSVFQWSAAYPIIALIALLSQSWRMYLIMVNLVTSPLLLCFLIMQESPRWIIQTGNVQKATSVLAEIGGERWNRCKAPVPAAEDVALIPTSRQQNTKRSKGKFGMVPCDLTRRAPSFTMRHLPNFAKIVLQSPLLRRQGALLSLAMFTCTAVYSTFFIRIPHLISNGVFATVAISGALRIWVPFVIVAADLKFPWFTRRVLLLSSLGAMIIIQAAIGIIILTAGEYHVLPTAVLSMLGGVISVSAFYMVVVQITIEFFPTLLRCRALSLLCFIYHMGGLAIHGLVHLFSIWVHFSVAFCVVLELITFGTCLVYLIDTKRSAMPDTMEQLEKFYGKSRNRPKPSGVAIEPHDVPDLNKY